VSKQIGEPVKAHADNDSMDAVFIWRRRLYRVSEVLGCWREPSEWWDGKAARSFVRENARNSNEGVYELYRLGEQWFLSRLLD
jgi:hypothetical protein